MSSSRKMVGTFDRLFVTGIVLAVTAGSLAIGIPRIASAVASPAPATAPSGLGLGAQVAPAAAPVTAEDKFDLAPAAAPAAAAAAAPALVPVVKSSTAPLPRPAAKPRPARKAAPARAARVAGGKVPTGSGAWRSARVSWYGPGFYGRHTASGSVLTPSSMVVAHRSLPFGTRIEFAYNGRTVIGVVADRGPFVSGRQFDLGPGVAQALGFGGVHTVQYRILGR